jgi:glyoxylase-like metal-dependent hydrolase (beta-lactamase superfamily II)
VGACTPRRWAAPCSGLSPADLDAYGVALLRAANPGPYTLDGTNTWLYGRDPAWVVDPGPDLAAHVDAVAAAVAARGGAAGIAVTHGHGDHVDGLDGLLARLGPVPVAVGESIGPLEAVPLPGHSDDHVVFVAGPVAFTGDAVLGAGSVFVEGRLGEYLDGLRRLARLDLELLCPGHGPPVWEPRERLEAYVAHRLDRERRLLEALDRGLRGEDELLDAVWDDAPAALRGAAAVTLRAHLEKLRDEGRLP